MKILGISAYYHDSAAALLIDGKPAAAAQQERFSRVKNDHGFPHEAIEFCLNRAELAPDDLDAIVFYDKPLLKFDRLLRTFLARAPKGYPLFRRALPLWLREKLWLPARLRRELPSGGDYFFALHHHSHAASAFYPSPFEKAAVLTVDGVGEWATCSYGIGEGKSLRLLKEIKFPHSLGLLYSAFTSYLGFKVNDGEYKVMGLAPYGEPSFLDLIFKKLVHLRDDGSFALNLDYFGYLDRLAMTNQAFNRLFGGLPRLPGEPFEQRHLDVAASLQKATEKILLALAGQVARETGRKNLCLAGGVALNSAANGRMLREGPFEKIWIQPAAGDAGGALGAAYLAHIALGGGLPPKNGLDLMSGALLGPEYSRSEMESALRASGLSYQEIPFPELYEQTARTLARGKIVGWFQGRMEFGPRALGNRSILADPRIPNMQRNLNLRIKFREGFRPFAPAVLEEWTGEYFDLNVPSPYMLLVDKVAKKQLIPVPSEKTGLQKLEVVRSKIPAVTHVDNSARIQTVNRETNPVFHDLISAFRKETGCPVILNTSFNVKDEPIVCSPADAVGCFLKTGLDILVMGPFWCEKEGRL